MQACFVSSRLDVVSSRTTYDKYKARPKFAASGGSLSRRAPTSAAATPVGSSSAPSSTPQQRDAASLDVSGAVVQPSFRSKPMQPRSAEAEAERRDTAMICLVSESGVCRNVLALVALEAALERRGLAGSFTIGCRASRNYNEEQGPDAATVAVAQELNWVLPPRYRAVQFEEARDIVEFDLVLVMDKFTAADVLREVSVFDTIETWGKGNYTSKVRRLGEFAPAAAAAGSDPEAGDIQDPLYGNVEPQAELAAVREAAALLQESCEGLADFLAAVEARHRQGQASQQQTGEGSGEGAGATGGAEQPAGLGAAVTAAARELGAMEWLVPPMLTPR